MPRRQTREIPRWRRGKTPQQSQNVIQIKGRKAVRLLQELDTGQAGQAGRHPNGAAVANDVLARTGAWRFRRQLPPFAWGIALAALGAALHAAPHRAILGPLAGIAAAVLLILFTRHLSAFARRWCDAAAFLTLTWLTVLSAAGFGPPAPAMLALTWIPFAGAWARHYRIRPGEGRQEPEQPVPDDDRERWDALAAERKWNAHLGAPERLPGGGRRYPVQCDGIKTVIGNVLSAAENVAGAWHKPVTEAYAERDPAGITSRGYLTILGRETLMTVREWNGAGMDPRTGMAVIGRYADGADAHVKLYTPRYGTRHSLVSGTTGSGKSQLLDELILIALASGVFVPVVLDPQEGQSLPFWRDRVLYAAGTGACHRMLRGLHAGMLDRSRYLASLRWDDDGIAMRGMPFFDCALTGLKMPFIIFDEAHMALKGRSKAEQAIVGDVTEIGRLGRKTGTELVLATHIPSLAELGGEHALRDMLRGGNVVSMRTANRVGAGMVGLEKDPSELPRFFANGKETYGLGYADGPDARPDAPMRTDLVPKSARMNVPQVPVLDDMFLEAMDRAMRAGGITLPPAPVALPPEVPEADGPEGRRCADAVLQVLGDRKAPMERGEIIKWVGELATTGWGRAKPFHMKSVGDALRALTESGTVVKVGGGVYQAAGTPETINGQGTR
jgi:Helicase HerA, central domain